MNIYFSENIKSFRKQRNLTQEGLADLLGVTFQAVSKWERGESFPDITLLPVIASFFDVSIDDLLGVDKAKNEEEILYIIDKFDNGKYHGSNGALGFVTEAYKKYPSDFRIVVRYLHVLINDCLGTDDLLKHKKEIISVYNRIQDYCTNDRIRIYAKNLIIHYYKPLTRIGNSGITAQDMYDIIETMPAIQDSKEVLMSYMPIDELTIKQGCRNLIDDLMYILDNTISHYCFYYDLINPEVTNEKVYSAIAGMELIRDIFNMVYKDGNYAKSWRKIIYTYGHLGELYHRIGNYDKALANLKICAELAKKFDTMPNETERTALFFEGTTLNKQEEVAMYLDTSVCDQMTRYMTEKYQLSDDFKNTPEFQSILDIMK